MAERDDGGEDLEVVVVDPVCGEPLVASDEETVTLSHEGRVFRFCGPACRASFARQVERAVLAEALTGGRLLAQRARARWGVA